jgi:type II restriction enzyme
MPAGFAGGYKSSTQQARVVTESWGVANLYCPACSSPRLGASPPNTQAIDYECPVCGLPFQLKSSQGPIGERIMDAGFEAMMRAIREDRTPNLLVLHYDRLSWRVKNLLLVPHFAFSASAVEKRKPLAATARRAGWVGCNIVLKNVPTEARIALVREGSVVPAKTVREGFRRVMPLKQLKAEQRGWTLDVLRLVQSRIASGRADAALAERSFTTQDAYAFVPELERLHPGNRHVRDKIRQQLQVLRDQGFLKHLDRGEWELTSRA